MGFNSCIVINNDLLGYIQKDKEFGRKTELAICRWAHDYNPSPICQGAEVVMTAHARGIFPILFGNCTGKIVKDIYIDENVPADDMETHLLKQLADKHGYYLRKKPKK